MFEMVQDFQVSLDSYSLLEKYLNLALDTVMDFNDFYAIKVLNPEKKGSFYLPGSLDPDKERLLPVLLVQGIYSKDYQCFNGYKPWVVVDSKEKAIRRIGAFLAWHDATCRRLFLQKCGDGYNSFFNHGDGSVEPGLDLRVGRSSPEVLVVSYCHIYYGK